MSTEDPRPPVRRIVTGHDADGRSCIVQDGASPAERLVPERPGYRMTNLWCTGARPHPEDADRVAEHHGVLPPAGGTVLRTIEWPAAKPATPEEAKRLAEITFRRLYPDAQHDTSHSAPAGMHRTDTVDYAIVLDGEVTAILEQGETVMRTGDVLIQRGTQHAWANRSGLPAKIAFVLIDAPAPQADAPAPMSADDCQSLDDVRREIDRLDEAIVELLAQRGRYVLAAARFKRDVSEVPAPARVEQVIAHVRQLATDKGGLPDVVEQGYRALISGFIEAERVHHQRTR